MKRLLFLVLSGGFAVSALLWFFAKTSLDDGAVEQRFSANAISEEEAEERFYRGWAELHPELRAGDFHSTLQTRTQFEGVANPEFKEMSESNLDPDSAVVGLIVDGTPYALVIESMERIDRHIVNFTHHDQAVSVVYCDLADEVRVCTRDSAEPIPLKVGGLDIDSRLVLELDGQLYSQSSTALPLDDMPFEKTTWAEWKRKHPTSRVYLSDGGRPWEG